MFLVPESPGMWRMCVDFRDLNKDFPKDCYLLSRFDQLVESTSGYELLSSMDSYQGYLHLLLAQEDQDKFRFIISRGIICYVVMIFGLKKVGATYQIFMYKIFERKAGMNVEVYVDEI